MKTRIRSHIAALTVGWTILAFATSTLAQTQFPTSYTFSDNVAYVSGGTSRQVMDIYRPTGATSATPVLLFVHGGGWNSGSAESYMDLWTGLGQGSFAIATMNYRYNSVVEPLAAQVDDVKAAIRFIKANAGTYNIDATRFGVMGQSAGGHLAGIAALSSDIAYFGSSSDLANTQNTSVSTAVQAVVTWAMPPIPPSGSSSLSLATYISSGDPSFRMFHSVNDELVNISFARAFRDSMVSGGVGATLTELTGGHFADDATRNANAPTIVSYLNQQFAAVPEPGTMALLGATAAAGWAVRRLRMGAQRRSEGQSSITR